MPSKEEIKVIINGEDKSKAAFNSAEKSTSGLESAVKKFGIAAGVALAAAAAAAGAFAVSCIKSFMEAEKEMKKANITLKNVATSAEDLEKLKGVMGEVGKAALKLGYDDEAASVSFAKLYSTTKDVTKAQEEVKLAMDLAAYSGRSFDDATQALMMVHAGGTRILREFGLQIGENATAADAMALVNDKVKGSAVTMADTTAGKLAILQESWKNLKEEIGGALAEALTPFITKLSEWVQSDKTQKLIKDISEALKDLMVLLEEFAKVVLPIVESVIMTIIVPAFNSYINLVKKLSDKLIENNDETGKFIDNYGKIFDELSSGKWELSQSPFWVFLDALATKINSLVNLFNKFTDGMAQVGSWIGMGVTGILGLPNPSVGTPYEHVGPFYQAGGIVPGMIGQPVPVIAHGGETILQAGGNRHGMGGNITLNINGGTYLSKDVAEDIGNKIIDILKLNLRF